jgi:hypothetical protein
MLAIHRWIWYFASSTDILFISEFYKFKFNPLPYPTQLKKIVDISHCMFVHPYKVDQVDQHLSKSIFCMEVLLVAIISLWGFLLVCQLSPLEGFYYHVMCDVINVKKINNSVEEKKHHILKITNLDYMHVRYCTLQCTDWIKIKHYVFTC